MKKLSLKLELAVFLFLFLVLVAFQEKSLAVLLHGLLAAVVSVLANGAYVFIRDRKFKLSECALITGLLIGFVLSGEDPWWSCLAAALIAILSKRYLRLQGRHLFNPAAFGAFVAVLFWQANTQWYGAYVWYVVIPFGLYFVSRIRKLPIVAAYYLTAVALYGAQAILQQTSLLDAILYLNHFFILIMLIEPKTSPFDKVGMIGYGALASALCFGLSFVNLPFSSELPVLLVVNGIFFLYQRIKDTEKISWKS